MTLKKTLRTVPLALFGLTLLVTAGCGDGGSTETSKTQEVAQIIPTEVFLTERPRTLDMLTEVKRDASVGQKVVFEARVGGRADPFIDGVAIFVAADPRLVSCDQKPGDFCKVPQDYCCENKEKLKAGTATIQMVDAQGALYPVRAEHQGGIISLKTVVIEGTVSEKGDDGLFVVDANRVWVGSIPEAPPTEEDLARRRSEFEKGS